MHHRDTAKENMLGNIHQKTGAISTAQRNSTPSVLVIKFEGMPLYLK